MVSDTVLRTHIPSLRLNMFATRLFCVLGLSGAPPARLIASGVTRNVTVRSRVVPTWVSTSKSFTSPEKISSPPAEGG